MTYPGLWVALILGALGLTIGGHDRVTLAADSAAEVSTQGFATLTSVELAAMLPRKDFFFVNVHIPYEGQIGGTDAFIPYDQMADNLDKLPANKDTKIVLYCRSGRMSETAARELIKLGYRRVSHLSGGMIAWEGSGYRVIRKPAP